ncbi:MAG: hypothetical protein JXX14_13160 [Deltaproteobacteria bacterium]|nr:hypothetical protein [Deltaproteobacteria bacterium]
MKITHMAKFFFYAGLGLVVLMETIGCGSSQESGNTIESVSSSTEPVDGDSSTITDTVNEQEDSSMQKEVPDKITVSLSETPNNGYRIVYAIWLENAAHTVVQNLFICERVLDGSLSGTALPYWSINRKDASTVDGVSGATILPSFSVTSEISSAIGNQFTVYVEVDHSFDENDWFDDQPALLFAADIDISEAQRTFSLSPVGWTVWSDVTFSQASETKTSVAGALNTEMRYITQHNSDGSFGAADDRSAVGMVQYITAEIK